MKFQYNVTEKKLRRELKARMASEPDPLVLAQIHQSLQAIREAAAIRAQERAKSEAAAEAAVDAALPKRREGETEEWFNFRMECHRLDMKEDACGRVLDSPLSSLRAIADAERELAKIEKRRVELGFDPTDGSSQTQLTAPMVTVAPKPRAISEWADREVIEKFNFERIFGTAEIVSQLQGEIENRETIIRVWKISGTDRFVTSNGKAVTLMTDTVCMGEIRNPNPPVMNAAEPFKPSPTPAQLEYWNRKRA